MEDRFSYPDPFTLLLQEVDGADRTWPFIVPEGVALFISLSRVLRSRRSVPPDFLFNIECFSSLSSDLGVLGVDSYESKNFEAGGYEWRLSVYPDGDKKRGGDGYISVYLVLVDTNNSFPCGWEIKVYFKLFVYDQIRDEYMTIQDLKIKRFHNMKTQHGFPKLMSLAILRNESNGYLRNDAVIFGAEIFFPQNLYNHWLKLHAPPRHLEPIFFKLENFSKLNKECYYSDVLSLGEKKWKYIIYPKGDRFNKGRLSVHLLMVDSGANSFGFGFNFMRWFRREKQETRTHRFFPHDSGFMVNFVFQILDQRNSVRNLLIAASHKFDANWTTSNPTIKCGDIMLWSDLMDHSKRFLVNDTLIVGVGYHIVCEVKDT